MNNIFPYYYRNLRGRIVKYDRYYRSEMEETQGTRVQKITDLEDEKKNKKFQELYDRYVFMSKALLDIDRRRRIWKGVNIGCIVIIILLVICLFLIKEKVIL